MINRLLSGERQVHLVAWITLAITVAYALHLEKTGDLGRYEIVVSALLTLAASACWVSIQLRSQPLRLSLRIPAAIILVTFAWTGPASLAIPLVPCAILTLLALSRTLTPFSHRTRASVWIATIVGSFVLPLALLAIR